MKNFENTSQEVMYIFNILKKLCTEDLNFTIRFGFRIIKFTIKEMVFKFFIKGGKHLQNFLFFKNIFFLLYLKENLM